jgi:glutathione S-transferase
LQISAAGAAWCSSEGGFEIANWPHLEAWARRLKAMPGFALPYDLIPSKDREFDPV